MPVDLQYSFGNRFSDAVTAVASGIEVLEELNESLILLNQQCKFNQILDLGK